MLCGSNLVGRPSDGKLLASVADFNIQSLLNLNKILIKLAAQIGQPRSVIRLQFQTPVNSVLCGPTINVSHRQGLGAYSGVRRKK